MTDLLDQHIDLALGAETGPARYATGAYGFWRLHVLALLREAHAPEPDALCDVLLAPLAPEVFTHQRERGMSPASVKAALAHLADGVLGKGV
jgi:hypothetical protein